MEHGRGGTEEVARIARIIRSIAREDVDTSVVRVADDGHEAVGAQAADEKLDHGSEAATGTTRKDRPPPHSASRAPERNNSRHQS